ncbi:hypothetical protein POTOM_024573 [Populus tomentosa]|uniref:Uncharacterized protein n=1 Tax=Populus tomentosa TaxID=118781 RepID=A0A8X7ZFL4_POPTO|nr:hypothetical protein POTOM_024573 [Populus tomentosa]
MGKENTDPIVIQSSIALLQERFRQLQRVKAMREEKELSRNIHVESTKQSSPTMQYHEPAAANRLFFHPELILQPRSPPHVCLSLWPNPQGKQAGFRCEETPALMSLSSTKSPPKLGVLDKFDASATDDDDDDDIDTSLHL